MSATASLTIPMQPMFRLENGSLWISINALEQAGIPRGTIDTGLQSFRKKESEKWQHIKNQYVWIVINSLPILTKQKLHLHFGIDLNAAWRAQEMKNKVAQNFNDSDILFFEDWSGRKNGQGLTRQRIQELTEACAWLRSVADTDFWKPIWRFKTPFYQEVVTILKQKKLYGLRVSNVRVLERKLDAFLSEGKTALLNNHFGKPSPAAKLNGEGFDYIIAYYARPTKPTLKKTTAAYNSLATMQGWATLTESRVLQVLKAHEALWYANRNGKVEAMQEIRPTIKTIRAKAANGKWELDGTALQLLYVDEQNKIVAALYIMYIVDQHSERIMGYAITKNPKEKESAILVKNAFNRAILDNKNIKPRQIAYDNSSAMICKEAQIFMSALTNAHFPVEPYNAGAKTIESTIGRIEAMMQEMFDNFKGGNITAKGKDRKANYEFAEKLRKQGLLPTADEIIDQAEQLVRAWNNRTAPRDNQTPNQRYYSSIEKTPELQKYLTEKTLRDLFWLDWKHPHKYRKDGIMVQLSNTHNPMYYVVEKNGTEDLAFRDQYFSETFTIKYDPRNLQQIALYQNGQFVAMANRKAEYHHAIEDQTEEERIQRVRAIAERNEYMTNKTQELKTIQQEVAAADYDTPNLHTMNQDQQKYALMELENLQFRNAVTEVQDSEVQTIQFIAPKQHGLYGSDAYEPLTEIE